MTLSTASVNLPGGNIQVTNLEETAEHGSAVSSRSVYQRVNEIFGYDFFEALLIAKGAREMSEESLRISESNLAAGAENLPSD
jgi:hypothetical protein